MEAKKKVKAKGKVHPKEASKDHVIHATNGATMQEIVRTIKWEHLKMPIGRIGHLCHAIQSLSC